MIHNHEVRSSILRPATRKHGKSLCSFCIYCRQTTPKGLDIGVAGRKSLHLKGAAPMSGQGAKRPWSDGFATQTRTRFSFSFLGYHATGQNGLEGALRATETSCVPLQEAPTYTKPGFCGLPQSQGPLPASLSGMSSFNSADWVSLLRAIHRAGYASTTAICRPG